MPFLTLNNETTKEIIELHYITTHYRSTAKFKNVLVELMRTAHFLIQCLLGHDIILGLSDFL